MDADCTGAKLRDVVHFTDAQLRGCKLIQVDMAGAKMSQAKNLTEASGLSGILLRGEDQLDLLDGGVLTAA